MPFPTHRSTVRDNGRRRVRRTTGVVTAAGATLAAVFAIGLPRAATATAAAPALDGLPATVGGPSASRHDGSERLQGPAAAPESAGDDGGASQSARGSASAGAGSTAAGGAGSSSSGSSGSRQGNNVPVTTTGGS